MFGKGLEDFWIIIYIILILQFCYDDNDHAHEISIHDKY
jgi:hypothetical protein